MGYRITKERIHADKSKAEAIANWPEPETPTDLRPFPGLAGYCRRFIKRFASRAAPLHCLVGMIGFT